MSNSALNESEYPMELIKLSCLTSFFFFELKVRKKSIAPPTRIFAKACFSQQSREPKGSVIQNGSLSFSGNSQQKVSDLPFYPARSSFIIASLSS